MSTRTFTLPKIEDIINTIQSWTGSYYYSTTEISISPSSISVLRGAFSSFPPKPPTDPAFLPPPPPPPPSVSQFRSLGAMAPSSSDCLTRHSPLLSPSLSPLFPYSNPPPPLPPRLGGGGGMRRRSFQPVPRPPFPFYLIPILQGGSKSKFTSEKSCSGRSFQWGIHFQRIRMLPRIDDFPTFRLPPSPSLLFLPRLLQNPPPPPPPESVRQFLVVGGGGGTLWFCRRNNAVRWGSRSTFFVSRQLTIKYYPG